MAKLKHQRKIGEDNINLFVNDDDDDDVDDEDDDDDYDDGGERTPERISPLPRL